MNCRCNVNEPVDEMSYLTCYSYAKSHLSFTIQTLDPMSYPFDSVVVSTNMLTSIITCEISAILIGQATLNVPLVTLTINLDIELI